MGAIIPLLMHAKTCKPAGTNKVLIPLSPHPAPYLNYLKPLILSPRRITTLTEASQKPQISSQDAPFNRDSGSPLPRATAQATARHLLHP